MTEACRTFKYISRSFAAKLEYLLAVYKASDHVRAYVYGDSVFFAVVQRHRNLVGVGFVAVNKALYASHGIAPSAYVEHIVVVLVGVCEENSESFRAFVCRAFYCDVVVAPLCIARKECRACGGCVGECNAALSQ